MNDIINAPQGFFTTTPLRTKERYTNPFYGVPLQYLPMNMDHMLWWADHFFLRFGFYRSALSRIANYFITSLKIECDNVDSKDAYREMFEQLSWKRVLGNVGLNLLAYGNSYISINRGFDRFLKCPKCNKVTNIIKLNDYTFDGKTMTYMMKCLNKSCTHNGKHEVVDVPSRNIKKTGIVIWNPREIKVRYEETTAQAEYYWDIPKDYINKVTKKNNKFYSKVTPAIIYECIKQNKMLELNKQNFVHLKLPVPAGLKTDGRALPLCMYLFDDFFMLKVLQRFNESICFEDISPFRVIAMSGSENPQSNPVLFQNATQWRMAVQQMIEEHRRDPGAYHIFPHPLIYEQLGGKGKILAPVELIQQTIANILNSLDIPQELYTMNLQIHSVTPALRLFENSWSFLVDLYNELLNKWAETIGAIGGLKPAKVELMPVTLSDDIERKSIIGQLAASNSIAKSELLNIFNFDYKEQVRKRYEEEAIQREIQNEFQQQEQFKQQFNAGMGLPQQQQIISPTDILDQAQEIAQQLFPLDGAQRRQHLQQIKAQNETLYAAVKAALEQLTAQARSQGVYQAKQQ